MGTPAVEGRTVEGVVRAWWGGARGLGPGRVGPWVLGRRDRQLDSLVSAS